MSRTLNTVQLIGNLGFTPEVRTTASGKKVTELSLATTESFVGRDGTRNQRTHWHRIILWEGFAEVAAKYLRKGSRVYIEGRLQYRSYEDKDGNTRYVTEIIGRNMVMLDAAPAKPGTSQIDEDIPLPFPELPEEALAVLPH